MHQFIYLTRLIPGNGGVYSFPLCKTVIVNSREPAGRLKKVDASVVVFILFLSIPTLLKNNFVHPIV